MNNEEDIATRFLRLSGYTILSRNDRRFLAELDILCRTPDGRELCIAEVKRRRQREADYPLISEKQRQRLIDAAQTIMREIGQFAEMRIMLLIVDAGRESVEVFADLTT